MTPVAKELTLAAKAARSSEYYYTGISWPPAIADALGNDANAQFQLLIEGKITPAQLEANMDAAVKHLQA